MMSGAYAKVAASLACVIAGGAIAVSLTHHGPAGPQGERGMPGPAAKITSVSYKVSYDNLTVNVKSTGGMTLQSLGTAHGVAGDLTAVPPLYIDGNGIFSGTLDSGAFRIAASSGVDWILTGTVSPSTGEISGTYDSTDLNQNGTWTATPVRPSAAN
jgi:hypothetical protein